MASRHRLHTRDAISGAVFGSGKERMPVQQQPALAGPALKRLPLGHTRRRGCEPHCGGRQRRCWHGNSAIVARCTLRKLVIALLSSCCWRRVVKLRRLAHVRAAAPARRLGRQRSKQHGRRCSVRHSGQHVGRRSKTGRRSRVGRRSKTPGGISRLSTLLRVRARRTCGSSCAAALSAN
jgi:hypothetical protein